jgi:hypothetical protein
MSMTTLTYSLADGSGGIWRLAFEPEALHLYVEFVRPGIASDPLDWVTIEDFLAWRPQDSLHKQALDNLISFLQEALSQGQ